MTCFRINHSSAWLPVFILIIIGSCVPITNPSYYSTKRLAFDNFNYEPIVGLVRVYPNTGGEETSMEYPIVEKNEGTINLSFDLLEENYRYIQARYIHCNADWSRSALADIQFLDAYNEFAINNYDYSSNTRIPYVNYRATLPIPKITGNYILAVYNEGNEDDLLFVRRFCVYTQKARISTEITQSNMVANRTNNHQIEFTVSYEGIDNPNPMQDFKVTLLQNHNWNTAISNLQPTLVRNDQKYMEYRHFNGENNFKGLNEFRFFDLRSIDYRGMNVSHIEKSPSQVEAYLNKDKPRGDLAYTQINDDLNGNYFLQNTDPDDSPSQSEYVRVHFELVADELDGDVFINGHLTNWGLSTNNLMVYHPASGSYKGSLLLKQGYYDYMYWVQSASLPADYLEGSNFQTRNNYEILLYYRNPSRNYDELIGYKKISSRN